MPQFVSLRSVARMLPGIKIPAIVSLEGICGDYPTVAKLTMRCRISGARFPCSRCMIDFNKLEEKYVNDPNRWLTEAISHRTQVQKLFGFRNFSHTSQLLMEESVERMRRDHTYKQIACGMRDACVEKSVPLFDYFSRADWDLDTFGVCIMDYMH